MPSKFEQDYVHLIYNILNNGGLRKTRNHPTYSLFGRTLVIDELREGRLPLISGRKMYPDGIIGEFAAFLHGVTKVEDFEKFGCNYWKQWADKDGSIRVDYGNSWRDFNGYDQLQAVIDTLKTNPADRRMLISGWRPDKLAELSLPCCHMLYQWYVNPTTDELEMIWYQRSVDTLVGLPSDILLAAVWNILLAQVTGFKPGRITMMLGDTHIYKSHYDKAVDYCIQAEFAFEAPTYRFNEACNFDNFKPSDILIENYNPSNPIKFEVYS